VFCVNDVEPSGPLTSPLLVCKRSHFILHRGGKVSTFKMRKDVVTDN
jgi:hypothetical protein